MRRFSSVFRLMPLFVALLFGITHSYAATPHVVPDNLALIVVDGLRPDAIRQAKTPVLENLIKRGASTMRAQTVEPSLTLPAFASLLSGLPVEEHGIDWNEYEPMRGYLKAPTFFEIGSLASGKLAAMFLNKEKLLHVAKPDRGMLLQMCSVTEPGCDAQRIAMDVITSYKRSTEGKPSIFIIHFADADMAGHEHGWMSKSYLRAVENCDRALGSLIKGFQELGLYKDMVMIVTSDHGGHDKTHGTSSVEDKTIPWIAAGPGIKAGYEIKQQVSLIDTGATALRALGITDYYVEWKSRTIDEIFLE
jgi:predicted AlkP superfamily pyrophosphatase or phosphodiesterase